MDHQRLEAVAAAAAAEEGEEEAGHRDGDGGAGDDDQREHGAVHGGAGSVVSLVARPGESGVEEGEEEERVVDRVNDLFGGWRLTLSPRRRQRGGTWTVTWTDDCWGSQGSEITILPFSTSPFFLSFFEMPFSTYGQTRRYAFSSRQAQRQQWDIYDIYQICWMG